MSLAKVFLSVLVMALALDAGRTAQVAGYDASARNPFLPTEARLGWRYLGNTPMVHQGNYLEQKNTGLEYGYFATPESLPAGTINVGQADYGISATVQPLADIPYAGGSDYANLILEWQDEQSYYSITFWRQFGVAFGPSGGALFPVDWSRPRTIYVGYNHGPDTFSFFLDGRLMAHLPRTQLVTGSHFIGPNQVCFGDATTGGPASSARWYSVGVFDRAAPSPVAVPLVEFDGKREAKTPDLARESWEFKGRHPMTMKGAVLQQDTTSEAPANSYSNYVSPGVHRLMRKDGGPYGIEFRVKPLSDLLKAGSSYYANLMVVWGDEEVTYRVSIDRNFPSAQNATGALLANGDAMNVIAEGIDWSEAHTIFIGYDGERKSFDFYVDGEWVRRMSASDLSRNMAFDARFVDKVGFGDFTSGQPAPNNVDVKAEWEFISLHARASKGPERRIFRADRPGEEGLPDTQYPAWRRSGAAMSRRDGYLLQDTTSLVPGNGHGHYISPKVEGMMDAQGSDYAVEFRVKPLSDLLDGGSSYYANLMVTWADRSRTFCLSIDKNYPNIESSTGALLANGDYLNNVVDQIDWSKPRTILVGYTKATDQFHIYVDNVWRKTVTAASLANGVAYQPDLFQRVGFGDFTSGQATPYNGDLKAEWWSVGLYGWEREAPPPPEPAAGIGIPRFSELNPAAQNALRYGLAPPPLAQRNNPYASAMYYPMWRLTNAGTPVSGSSPDGRYHPEWQRTLIENWAALGMKNLHINVFPDGTGTPSRNYVVPQSTRLGLANVASCAARCGMKIILRADPPCTQSGYWPAHPRNPANELNEYLGWLQSIIDAMSGQVYAVIPGDEIAEYNRITGQEWTLEDFQKFVVRIADGLHSSHPGIKVSTPSFGTGSWQAVMGLFREADTLSGRAAAVAINLEDTAVAAQYKADLLSDPATSSLELFANGVGYISSQAPRNPNWETGYYSYSDPDQAGLIAQSLYQCWRAGMGHAPYYSVLRNFENSGRVDPLYYGFFGFMDLKISSGQAHVVTYLGWKAFQTMASTLYDVDAFAEPDFSIRSTGKRVAFLEGHERKDGRELVLVAWGEGYTDIEIDSDRFAVPFGVDLLDGENWTDVTTEQREGTLVLKRVALQGQRKPIILRIAGKGHLTWPPPDSAENEGLPRLVSVVSRLTHGAAGVFDLPLPLTGTPGTETRRSADHQFEIVCQFDRPLAAVTPFLYSAMGVLGDFTLRGDTLTVGFSGAANAQTALLELKNVRAVEGSGQTSYPIYFKLLQGDVNADGFVDQADVAEVKSKLSPGIDAGRASYDVNASGAVNTGDVLTVKSQFATSAP